MAHSGNNSGSIQSSSGGDDQEYDSLNESNSQLFNSCFASIPNNPYTTRQPPLSHHLPPSPTLIDPQLQAHNLHPFPNSLDLVWSRSDPNYSNPGNLRTLSSSTQPILGLNRGPNQGTLQSDDRNSPTVALNSFSDQNQSKVGKNSRKRTRASRRPPTTVLTTDALNFRQMVQEFTGIPEPPFSSSPYSGRLDLFGGGGSALRSGHLEPFYPFRPSAQNPVPNNYAMNFQNPVPNNYAMNFQNPVPNTLQSLLQSNEQHFGTKSQGSLGIPDVDELGIDQQPVSATNLTNEFSIQVRDNHNNLTRSWRGEEEGNDQDQQLVSFDGINGYPKNGTGSNYKMK